MKDEEMKQLIKTLDTDVVIPDGLKENLLVAVLSSEGKNEQSITLFERFVFEKPLRFASCVAISISGINWLVMGDFFAKLMNRMIG